MRSETMADASDPNYRRRWAWVDTPHGRRLRDLGMPVDHDVLVCTGDGGIMADPEDAAIVAAAPDLLAACEAVIDRLDYLRSLWGDEAITRNVADQVRAAVARATTPEA
jgi:hypothetical protein